MPAGLKKGSCRTSAAPTSSAHMRPSSRSCKPARSMVRSPPSPSLHTTVDTRLGFSASCKHGDADFTHMFFSLPSSVPRILDECPVYVFVRLLGIICDYLYYYYWLSLERHGTAHPACPRDQVGQTVPRLVNFLPTGHTGKTF